MSFQDFYQRCREAFLVNSDLTLRTQLTEFRDHKLIRTRKVYVDSPLPLVSVALVVLPVVIPVFFSPHPPQGADGVEFLIVAVDTGTLTDFLENEEVKWQDCKRIHSKMDELVSPAMEKVTDTWTL